MSTDSQIDTLGIFRCQCIQIFPTQNSAPQAWIRDQESRHGRQGGPCPCVWWCKCCREPAAVRESQHNLRVWSRSIFLLSTYISFDPMILKFLSPFLSQLNSRSSLSLFGVSPFPLVAPILFFIPLVRSEPWALAFKGLYFSQHFLLRPLITRAGSQPRVMGIVLTLKRLLEVQYRTTIILAPFPQSSTNLRHLPTRTAGAMAQVIAGDPVNLEVHFLHSDNPRHGFSVMSVNPLTYYDFQTPIGFRETHTIVRTDPPSLPQATCYCTHPHILQVTDDSGATIVTFNWFGPSALGTMTWPGPPAHEAHMGDLVMPHHSMSK